jgi:DNA-binding MarR family transcriptional regulator
MEKQIYSYALIKALSEEGQDYIDSFWPFVLKILFKNRNTHIQISSIQKYLKSDYGLQIPIHPLKIILKRVVKKKFIEKRRNRNEYYITDEGLKYAEEIEEEHNVDRRINELFYDIKEYFQEEFHISYDINDIQKYFYSFIQTYLDSILQYLNPTNTDIMDFQIRKLFERSLIKYIQIAENRKPKIYETIKDIAYGSIFSLIFNIPDISDMKITHKFSNCQIFLDCNYILSILRLHSNEFNEPALELFNLLKEFKFQVKVFSFTVKEITRLLNGYCNSYYHYSPAIPVGHIYSSLKIKGYTIDDIKDLIINLENKLSNNGIQYELVKDIDLENFVPSNKEWSFLIKECKPEQEKFSQNHDLAAMEKISDIRGDSVFKLEKAKAIFLTSDIKLSYCNFFLMGHKDNCTISEVISDRLLTSILWFIEPKSNIPLKSLIAAHSRSLFIKEAVWDRFIEIFKEIIKKGKISEKNLESILFHKYINDVLIELDESDIEKINDKFVLDLIEGAKEEREKLENRYQNKVEQLEEEKETLKKSFKQQLSDMEKQKNESWLEKVDKLKESFRNSSNKKADKESLFICVLIWILLFGLIYLLYVVLKYQVKNIISWIALGVTFLASNGCMIFLWRKLRDYFKDISEDYIYRKKLNEAGLKPNNL